MRVAMVLSNPLPPREGIGTYAARLARRLQREGIEVVLFTRSARGTDPEGWLEQAGSPPLKVVRPRFLPLYPLHVHLHAGPMRAALRKEGPFDVVHLHTPLPPPVGAADGVATVSVVTVHTPMAEDVRTLRWGEPMALAARLQLPVSMAIERRLLREAAAVTAVSQSVSEALKRRYRVPPGRVQVVPNGVDVASIRPVVDGRDDHRLLYVGRLGGRKGLPDLVKAMAGLETFRLEVVGDGPLMPWLRGEVARAGLSDRVTLHGFLARERLEGLWGRATLFVHVPTYEGMPTSLLEAMAHGLPVVTTDAPGTRDIVTDGATGRLVPLDRDRGRVDVAALQQAVRALADAPEERRRLALGARRQVEEHHDWRDLGPRMLEVYRSALASAERPLKGVAHGPAGGGP